MKKKLFLKPVLIYLDPAQKARLARRARQQHSSLSQQVRRAIELYLDLPGGNFDEMADLAQAANYSADRSLQHLETAIHSVRGVLPRTGKELATTRN
jgi:Ribbon-helix-helix protein, copG family